MIFKVGDTISYFEIRFDGKLKIIKDGYKIVKEKNVKNEKGQLLVLDLKDDYKIITSEPMELSPYNSLNKPFVVGRIGNDILISFVYTNKPTEAIKQIIDEMIKYCFKFAYTEYAEKILELSKEL